MLCLVYGMWHCHLLRNFLPHTGAVDDALRRALAPPLEAGDTNQYGEWARETPDVNTLRHKLLAYDQRSFITGSASAGLQDN